MEKLFVNKSIAVNATASRVWDALTKPENTVVWAAEFSSGGPRFHIESDWQPGSAVLWKAEDGVVIVEGNVTAVEPEKMLRFTVFDTRSERPKVSPEDGITFELSEQNKKTTLHVLHGDFGVMENGKKYYEASAATWDRVLPKIKSIAEN